MFIVQEVTAVLLPLHLLKRQGIHNLRNVVADGIAIKEVGNTAEVVKEKSVLKLTLLYFNISHTPLSTHASISCDSKATYQDIGVLLLPDILQIFL